MSDLNIRVGDRTEDFRRGVQDMTRRLDPALLDDHQRWRGTLKAPALPLGRGTAGTKAVFGSISGLLRDLGEPIYLELLSVPFDHAKTVPAQDEPYSATLPMLGPLGAGDILAGITLTKIYFDLSAGSDDAADDAHRRREIVMLKPEEIEVMRWAVAGKTVEEIATITGVSYRNVRFHMEQVRLRYGFATTRQTLVKVAIDYQLDPLGR